MKIPTGGNSVSNLHFELLRSIQKLSHFFGNLGTHHLADFMPETFASATWEKNILLLHEQTETCQIISKQTSRNYCTVNFVLFCLVNSLLPLIKKATQILFLKTIRKKENNNTKESLIVLLPEGHFLATCQLFISQL